MTIETDLKTVDFFRVILDLVSGAYRSSRKPNKKLSYVNTGSCNRVIAFKKLTKTVNRRISILFSSEEIFDADALYYNKALAASVFKEKISHTPKSNLSRRK